MSEDLNKKEKEKEDAKNILSKEFKERLNKNVNVPCDKCTITQKDVIVYSCSHRLCFNCIFKNFMSCGFKGITTLSVKAVCPKCKKGKIEIALDDYIDVFKQLLDSKDQNYLKEKEEEKEKEEKKEEKKEEEKKEENKSENANENENASADKNCKEHEDQKLIKHCNDCDVDLCEKCLEESHKDKTDHVLVDINMEEKKEDEKKEDEKNEEEKKEQEKKEEEKKDENKKEEEKKDENKKESYGDNREINILKEKEKKFMEKLENESNTLKSKIDQIIQDLNTFFGKL